MADKLDFKKEYKDLYHPGKKPSLIQVPAMPFIYMDGLGAPESECYQNGVSVLYTLTFAIKFSGKGGKHFAGFFEYVPPPLEGLWVDVPTDLLTDRQKWRFTSLIRQPDFVTPEVFEWALAEGAKKKPELDFSVAHFGTWAEGLCVQAMHNGPFSDEPATVEKMHDYINLSGCKLDFNDDIAGLSRRHHELYLTNPQKTKPENMRTILRLPVAK